MSGTAGCSSRDEAMLQGPEAGGRDLDITGGETTAQTGLLAESDPGSFSKPF
jgi:hypothetical protein